MLSFTPEHINGWLLDQPGGRHAIERGLGSDVMPEALLALERLATALEDTKATKTAHLHRVLTDPAFLTALRTLAAHLSLARRYRLLAWMADADPVHASPVLHALLDTEAPPAGSGAMLHADILRQHRLGLLAAIFDPARIQRVQAACRREAA